MAKRARTAGSAGRGWLGCLVATLATAGIGFVLIGSLTLTLALLGVGGFQSVREALDAFTRELPEPDQAIERQVFRTAQILDRSGELLYEFFDPNGGKRTLVPLRQLPDYLIAATIATEDAQFYTNPGFDPIGIARAVVQNLRGQGIVSGGSTITQQLIRNALFDTEERYEISARRKLKEIILAYRLSQKYSKEEILERYLNEIFYGNLAYGVEAAAQVYFDKPARELTLAEASLLAGIPQSPAAYNPFTNLRATKARQADVLELMVRHGYITAEQALAAFREPLRLRTAQREMEAPHFVLSVREELEKRYTRQQLFYSGLKVYTTLDLALQHQAEAAVREHLARLRQYDASNAAVVGIDPRTGEVLVYVGSADYWDEAIAGQVNMALAERQPGSTLKPFTYGLAFSKGMAAPAAVLIDEPMSFPGAPGQGAYRPTNPDGKFRGPVTVRRALANSLNIPALKMLDRVGVRPLIDLLHQAGITSLDDPRRYGLTLTLGGGEVRLLDLTFAYTVFANQGNLVGRPVAQPKPGFSEYAPATILRVVDDAGREFESYAPPRPKRVLTPQVAWLVTDILADVEARTEIYGPNTPLTLTRPAAAKTGTTDNYEDAWTVGYTPDLVVGVWVGNADHRPMKHLLGVAGAGQIWHTIMEGSLAGRAASPFPRPPGLVQAMVDPTTGLPPQPGQKGIVDWFLEGSVPSQVAVPTAVPSPPMPPPPSATPHPPPTATSVRPPSSPTVAPPSRTATPAAATPPAASPSVTALATRTTSVAPTRTSAPATTATPSDRVLVPRLVGLTEPEARRQVDQAGLTNTYTNYQMRADVTDKRFFDSIPRGSVLSQVPAPGAEVRRGTTVFIAVRKE